MNLRLLPTAFARAAWCGAGLLLLAGCAAPTAPKPQARYFFPPPPEAPRLQFLASYASSLDVTGGKADFASFVTGQAASKDPIIKPYGLAIRDGKIYVADTMASALEVLDVAKHHFEYFVPDGEGRLPLPVNLVFDTDGTRYVADTGRHQVVVFDPQGKPTGALGAKDEMQPCDVLLQGDRLYVADLKGHCVRIFDKGTRKQVGQVPADAKDEAAKLFNPTNLAMDSQGRLYVADTGAFQVKVYDPAGKFLRNVGTQGIGLGEFALPKGIALDRADRLYVVDAATQVIQIFDPEGKLLMFFGEPKESPVGLALPAKVIVDYDNVKFFQSYAAPGFTLEYLVLVTNQVGDRKVAVFGFGHRG